MPNHVSLLLYVHLHTVLTATLDQGRQRLAARDDRGQATTEYALVLLAAALVGLMVVAWATAGGGAARISRLFNSVIDAVIDRV
jgi:Flp pilus assembly pilin Flp